MNHDANRSVSAGDGDDDLRAFLQAGDPASALVPLDDGRIEQIVADITGSPRHATPTPVPSATSSSATRRRKVSRTRLGVVGGAGAGIAATAAAAIIVTSGGSQVAATTELTNPAATATGPAAMCATVTSDTLRTLATAFEAHVVDIVDGRVVLTVTKRFKGAVADRVTVAQSPPEVSAEFSPGQFDIDRDYLIGTTDGTHIAVCGASGPVDPELLTKYEQAFPHH